MFDKVLNTHQALMKNYCFYYYKYADNDKL